MDKYRHLKNEIPYTPGNIPTFDEIFPKQKKNEIITTQQQEQMTLRRI